MYNIMNSIKDLSNFLLKNKLVIILLLFFLFIGTCHCVKPEKLGTIGKTIEAKTEGFKQKLRTKNKTDNNKQ